MGGSKLFCSTHRTPAVPTNLALAGSSASQDSLAVLCLTLESMALQPRALPQANCTKIGEEMKVHELQGVSEPWLCR